MDALVLRGPPDRRVRRVLVPNGRVGPIVVTAAFPVMPFK